MGNHYNNNHDRKLSSRNWDVKTMKDYNYNFANLNEKSKAIIINELIDRIEILEAKTNDVDLSSSSKSSLFIDHKIESKLNSIFRKKTKKSNRIENIIILTIGIVISVLLIIVAYHFLKLGYSYEFVYLTWLFIIIYSFLIVFVIDIFLKQKYERIKAGDKKDVKN